MKRIYVAHPYGGNEKNKESVEKLIKEMVKENPDILYISPIHALGYLYNDVSYEDGMRYCFELLKTCDELLLCFDWRHSRGCNMEKNFAKKNNIPVSYAYYKEG